MEVSVVRKVAVVLEQKEAKELHEDLLGLVEDNGACPGPILEEFMKALIS